MKHNVGLIPRDHPLLANTVKFRYNKPLPPQKKALPKISAPPPPKKNNNNNSNNNNNPNLRRKYASDNKPSPI